MKHSAGIIPFRINSANKIEFFVGHPGGNIWKKIDYWAFLKGGINKNEERIDAAIREFKEESGIELPKDRLFFIGEVKQNPHKTVIAYCIHYPYIKENECFSNQVENESFPEIDKYRWLTFDELKDVTHIKHIPFYEKIIQNYENYIK